MTRLHNTCNVYPGENERAGYPDTGSIQPVWVLFGCPMAAYLPILNAFVPQVG